jgi:hypothetical protein
MVFSHASSSAGSYGFPTTSVATASNPITLVAVFPDGGDEHKRHCGVSLAQPAQTRDLDAVGQRHVARPRTPHARTVRDATGRWWAILDSNQ